MCRPADHLGGREAEAHRVRAFRALATTSGGSLPLTAEPGVGRTEFPAAASQAVFARRLPHHPGGPNETGRPLAMRNRRLFIVGSPKVTTPVIDTTPLAALDLPLCHRIGERTNR
jgi:hypothetical protein